MIISVRAAELKRALNAAITAASGSPHTSLLCSVWIAASSDQMIVYGSDGLRLCEIGITATIKEYSPAAPTKTHHWNISLESAKSLRGFLKSTNHFVDLEITHNKIAVNFGFSSIIIPYERREYKFADSWQYASEQLAEPAPSNINSRLLAPFSRFMPRETMFRTSRKMLLVTGHDFRLLIMALAFAEKMVNREVFEPISLVQFMKMEE